MDETDDVDRVLLWENDVQFKKVRKSQYMIFTQHITVL